MRQLLKLLGSKFVAGFFALLPFLLTYLMVGQLFDLLMALTAPVADVLPTYLFNDLWIHRLTAAGMLIVIFVLAGFAMHSAPARRLGGWVERSLLSRFPPYKILKSLSQWLAGKDVPDQLQPALLTVAPDTRMLVAIVEELPGGEKTVFVPFAPTPGIGYLQIVGPNKVERLDASMADALGWVLNWGSGTEALFQPPAKPRAPSRAGHQESR